MRLLAFTVAALALAAAPSAQAATCTAAAHKHHRHHRTHSLHRAASHCSCRARTVQKAAWTRPLPTARYSTRMATAYEYARGPVPRTTDAFADPALAPLDVGPEAPGPNSPYADLAR